MKKHSLKLTIYYLRLERILRKLSPLLALDERGAARRIICPLDGDNMCTIISACDPDGIVSHTMWFWSEGDEA